MKTFVYLTLIVRTAYGLNVLHTDRKTEERSLSKDKSQSDKTGSFISDFQHKLDKVYHAIKGTNGKERRGFFGHPEISIKFEFPAYDEPKHKQHRSTSLESSSSFELFSSEIDSWKRNKEEKKKNEKMKKKSKKQKEKDKEHRHKHKKHWEKGIEQWKKYKEKWKEQIEEKWRLSSHIMMWVTDNKFHHYTLTWPTGGNWPTGIMDKSGWDKYWATATEPIPTELVGWSEHWATASGPWLTGGTGHGGPKPTQTTWASKNTWPSWASHNTYGYTKDVGAVEPE